MPLFSKVPLYCNNCGTAMLTDFHEYGGRFCCHECDEEYSLKHAHCVLGIEWKPTTSQETKDDLR